MMAKNETTPAATGHFVAPAALIGFGEAARAFVSGWAASGMDVAGITAFDIKTDNPASAVAGAKRDDYDNAGIRGTQAIAEALNGAPAVFSLVTADQAFTAAEQAAAVIGSNAFYFDCNSCSPDTKRRSAKIIEAAGGRYVDTAVLAPVHPALHRTPLLLSGPHADDGAALLTTWDMIVDVIAGGVGKASAVKMIRSVMVKGLEALVLECVLAARTAGIDQEVMESLEKTYPGFDWHGRAAYMMERVTTHGIRRAAEMRESAKTVRELGLSGAMTDGTVVWQQAIGDLHLPSGDNDYRHRGDAILAALAETGGK